MRKLAWKLASVLLLGFKPVDKPTGSILVRQIESWLYSEFNCTLITINIKFKRIISKYYLLILISSSTPIT